MPLVVLGVSMKKVFGWILGVWGLLGIFSNIAFVVHYQAFPMWLIINTIVCVLFIWAGWRLNNPNKKASVICPICGESTELKTAKKGENIGAQYYVCIDYPQCKGRIKA